MGSGVGSCELNLTVPDLIDAISGNGMHLEYFHEFPENFWNSGGDMEYLASEKLYAYPHNRDKYPMSYSLKATVYQT